MTQTPTNPQPKDQPISEVDEPSKSKIDWSTPYDEWLIPLLNDFRYSGPIICRAIPSAIQVEIDKLLHKAEVRGAADALEGFRSGKHSDWTREVLESAIASLNKTGADNG